MPNPGEFVSADTENAAYRIGDDGLRHWVPSPDMIDGPVQEMPAAELHGLPVGDPLASLGAIKASDGMLIHNPDNGNVFQIRAGLKRFVVSPASMEQHGLDWAGLIDIGPAYLNAIPD